MPACLRANHPPPPPTPHTATEHAPPPSPPQGLDVFEHEPAMAPGLAQLPNAVIVPHIASASMWTRSGMVRGGWSLFLPQGGVVLA